MAFDKACQGISCSSIAATAKCNLQKRKIMLLYFQATVFDIHRSKSEQGEDQAQKAFFIWAYPLFKPIIPKTPLMKQVLS
ncbi:MAG: hypothetical protein IKT79_07620, partial [Akkermansia sp.]|nr:hypothetical protein [Akkermansia sp.]